MFAKIAPAPDIEIPAGFVPRPEIRMVVFDFDGTLSWLRHGWPRLMAGLFLEWYPAIEGETPESIIDSQIGEILSTNGKPTIFQMTGFHERARLRGVTPPDPEELRREYQSRLDAIIAARSAEIQAGRAAADEFVVAGARAFLEKLRARGSRLVILSGTIEHRVREEAELLGLADFFGPHIYGSGADASQFAKKSVIDRLLREEAISGRELLSFGDGSVEISETKAVGGLAVAIASNEEHNGSGIVDPWKRRQLLHAGADAVTADFRAADRLIEMLLGV